MPLTNAPNADQNPNHKIPQPSSPISAQINLRNVKIKPNNPNYDHLPEQVWFLILSKLYTIDIIENVQKVCKLFRKICVQPSMFRIINMTLPGYYGNLNFDVNKLTRFAVDRSDGELVDVYVEYCCDDHTLTYIFERSKKLKHLRLGHRPFISCDALLQAMHLYGTLEEVELTLCKTPYNIVESIGSVCRSLKSFSLNQVGSRYCGHRSNYHALAIAKTMPNLRHLQLVGNQMTNDGLKAILDGCPLLESLDLRACFRIGIWGALRDRCESIKHFRHPEDSTADCKYTACTDVKINYALFDEEMGSVYMSDSDSDGSSDNDPEYLGSPKFNTPSVKYDDSYFAYLSDCSGNLYDCSGLEDRYSNSESSNNDSDSECESESSNNGSDSDSKSN